MFLIKKSRSPNGPGPAISIPRQKPGAVHTQLPFLSKSALRGPRGAPNMKVGYT
jgi:hypothetical protein